MELIYMLFFRKKRQPSKEEKDAQRTKEDLNEITLYLDDLLNFLPLATCDISPSGAIMIVNKEFENLTGLSSLDVVGKNLADIFWEREKTKELIVETRKRGVIKNQELALALRGGKKIMTSVSMAIRRDENESIVGYFVGIADVSILEAMRAKMEKEMAIRTNDLEQSREALLNILEDTEMARAKAEEEKRKSETIFTNFIDGLIVFDPAGRVELINPRAEEMLKASKKDLLGKKMIELEKLSSTKALVSIFKGELKEVFRQELLIGEELYLEITSTFIVAQGQKSAFLIILHDITREKSIEQMKSQFVSVAAHQLRTPLSIIKWSLDMFIKGDAGKITAQQKDFLNKTFLTNERLIRIINDLLNVAKIEEGRYIYQPKILEFNELVEQTFDSLKDLAKRRGISYKLNVVDGKKPKVVKVDVEKMSLAIKNLLENALKYTAPKGKILVQLERKNNHLEVFVKDSGVGIPKDQQPRIFSKFFRSANVIKMETDGSGLGLFIAKNVIEAHGGKIWFESVENKGTTFFFTLPTII